MTASTETMISSEPLACPAWCDFAGQHGWEFANALSGEATRSHEHKLDEPSDPFGVYIGSDDRLGDDGMHRGDAVLYVSAPEFGRGFTLDEAQRFADLLSAAVRKLEALDSAQ